MSSHLSKVIGMCQLMLGGGSAVTSARIAEVVDQICSMPTFGGVDRAELQRVLEERFTVYMPASQILDSDDGHEEWLEAKKSQISWRFWERYKLHTAPKMPPMSFDTGVDKVTHDVLSRLEDPSRPGMWDRRGLVVGHVQSGKTANYTGLVAKAADAGYKVIIVLTGMHESLRCQTQIRLDEGFLGRKDSFAVQNSVLVAGTVENRQPPWPCQKQPWTKITTLYRERTRSGLPGMSRGERRYRNPKP